MQIYKILLISRLLIIGDGFYLHDANDFVESYPAWKSEGY